MGLTHQLLFRTAEVSGLYGGDVAGIQRWWWCTGWSAWTDEQDGHKGNKILIRACWQGRNMYAKYVPHLFSCHLTSMVRMMVFDRSYWGMKCKRRRTKLGDKVRTFNEF